MRLRTTVCVTVLLVASVAVVVTTKAQQGAQKNRLVWATRLSEARGPFRTADVTAPLGRSVSSQVLGGPSNGSDAGYLIYTRMPAGAHGPALFTLPADHLYLVLSGKMTIQIGTDPFTAGPDTGVMVPAGIPHAAWNAETTPEAHVEVIAPAPSRDLMSMLKPAEPRKVDNASQYVRPAPPLPAELRPGLNPQRFFARNTGSSNQMRIDSSPAGSGNANTHIHAFEQVYFVKEGTMTLLYGLSPAGQIGRYTVPANSFVIIPPGVVHGNFNEGPGVERHVVWLLPEPEPGVGPLDVPVELKPPPAPGRGRGEQQ
jgi:mannose-6-phosphate isomerase-like protein (cupin superfamily)